MASASSRYGLFGGIALFLVGLLTGAPEGVSPEAWSVALVALLMAVWWMTEALPLAATALVPMVAFPALGVMPTPDVTESYGNHLIFLFLGGFFIAVTIQRWGLHRRIALHTIRLVGTDPRRMILGFMLATAFLSMWISNTATAMMMLPIALAVLEQSRENAQHEGRELASDFGVALMLAVAYSASIGGMATLIGTPPNAILAGVAERTLGMEIGFARWMAFGVPLSVLLLGITWVLLAYGRRGRGLASLPGGREVVERELHALGSISGPERRVLAVFLLVALSWIMRGLLPGDPFGLVNDTSIAMAGALALFLLPSGEPGKRLLDWDTAVRVPWDIVLLFGGGFALAAGFTESGLSEAIGESLAVLEGAPLLLVIGACTLLVIFLTEVTSNTATASLFVPLMASLAVATQLHPMALMVPVALAASCAFMLPVATPPNAVVFGSRAVTVPQMARAGTVLNLVATVLITLFVLLLLPAVLGIDLTEVPSGAEEAAEKAR